MPLYKCKFGTTASLECPGEMSDSNVGHTEPGITAVQKARPRATLQATHISWTFKLSALNWYCTPTVTFHERNALTVPVNGCLHTAHVESDGAHFTQATR